MIVLFAVLFWASNYAVQGKLIATCNTDQLEGIDTCNGDSLLHVQYVFWGAHNGNQSACHYLHGDCRATVADFQHIMRNCSGRRECTYRISKVNAIQCPGQTRLRATQYLQFEYECVPNSSTLGICSDRKLEAATGYIISPGYPDLPPSMSRDCSCVIESMDRTHVNLTIIDLSVDMDRFAYDNPCSMKISLNQYEFCRGNKRNWNADIMHDVTDTSLQLRVSIDSPLRAKFWLKYQANSMVTVTCREMSSTLKPDSTIVPSSTSINSNSHPLLPGKRTTTDPYMSTSTSPTLSQTCTCAKPATCNQVPVIPGVFAFRPLRPHQQLLSNH